MSDELGYEYEYDEDFDDEASADENNNDRDSGMFEGTNIRAERSNSLETTDLQLTKTPPGDSLTKQTKKITGKPGRTYDPYKVTNPTSRRAQSDPRGRKPPRRPGGTNSNNRSSARSTASYSSNNELMMNRVLSANRKKTASLHNALVELQQQCEELRIENKDLKRSIRIQDRDLRKYDGEEADLPMIMKRHNNEIKVLQEKFKKQKEMSTNLSENLRKADAELLKTRDKLKEFQSMAKEKNLGERVELKNKVLDLQYAIEEKEGKISELNRAMLLQKKTQNRIVKEKNEKYAKAMQRIKALEEENANMRSRHGDSNSGLKVNDEKQMVLSPQNPISPLLKKLEEENTEPTPRVLLLTENEGIEDELPVKPLVNSGRIDTMVNTTEHDDSTDQSEVDETFLTQGKVLEPHTNENYLDTNTVEDDKRLVANLPVAKISPRSSVRLDDEEKDIREDIFTVSKPDTPLEEISPSPPSPPQIQSTAKESDDAVKNRKILLAKLQAIDQGQNPNDVTVSTYNKSDEKKKKEKKPIFLMSANNTESKESPKVRGDRDESALDSANDTNRDSKPSSGNSRSRRVEALFDTNQDKAVDRQPQRKDSLESRKTDDKFLQGLSSRTTYSPQTTNRSNSGNDKKSVFGYDDNSDSIFGADNDSIFGGKKDSIPHENSKPPRSEQSYSPSLSNNLGADKKGTKGAFSLFDQFEDPFKSSGKSSSNQGSVLNRKSDQPELFSRASESIDDLDEMFIL